MKNYLYNHKCHVSRNLSFRLLYVNLNGSEIDPIIRSKLTEIMILYKNITARFTSFAQFIFERYFWLLSTFFDHWLNFCYYEIEHLSKKRAQTQFEQILF